MSTILPEFRAPPNPHSGERARQLTSLPQRRRPQVVAGRACGKLPGFKGVVGVRDTATARPRPVLVRLAEHGTWLGVHERLLRHDVAAAGGTAATAQGRPDTDPLSVVPVGVRLGRCELLVGARVGSVGRVVEARPARKSQGVRPMARSRREKEGDRDEQREIHGEAEERTVAASALPVRSCPRRKTTNKQKTAFPNWLKHHGRMPSVPPVLPPSLVSIHTHTHTHTHPPLHRLAQRTLLRGATRDERGPWPSATAGGQAAAAAVSAHFLSASFPWPPSRAPTSPRTSLEVLGRTASADLPSSKALRSGSSPCGGGTAAAPTAYDPAPSSPWPASRDSPASGGPGAPEACPLACFPADSSSPSRGAARSGSGTVQACPCSPGPACPACLELERGRSGGSCTTPACVAAAPPCLSSRTCMRSRSSATRCRARLRAGSCAYAPGRQGPAARCWPSSRQRETVYEVTVKAAPVSVSL